MTTTETLPEIKPCESEPCTRILLLSQLACSPYQKRSDYGDIAHLAQSILERGILNPLIVRSKFDEANQYEIIAGHRRLQAAMEAKLTEVPCRVMECDDQTAEELVLIDNAQRKDLDLLELTDTIAQLWKHAKISIKDLSSRLAMPVETVRQAIAMDGAGKKLLKAYADSRKEGNELAHYTEAMWAELARLPEQTQDRLLEKGIHYLHTLARLREMIRHQLMVISEIKWDLGDATFKCARACTGCLFRSDANKELFPDLNIAKKKADARCLDPMCFGGKLAEHKNRLLVKAQEEHGKDLKRITTTYHDTPIPGVVRVQEYDLKQMVQPKPGKDTTPVFNEDKMVVEYMKKPKASEDMNPKLVAKAPIETKEGQKQREDVLEARRWKWVADRMKDMLNGREGMKIEIPAEWSVAHLAYGLSVTGGQVHGMAGSGRRPKVKDLEEFMKEDEEATIYLASAPVLTPLVDAFKLACSQCIDFRTAGEANRKDLEWVAGWWVLNLDKLFEDAEKAIPTPKALAAAQAKPKGKEKELTEA